MTVDRVRIGVVESFDAERGLGTVRDDAGRILDFHCTAVADGSRRIAVGTAVTFVTAAGHRGRVEARRLVSVPAAGTDPPEEPQLR